MALTIACESVFVCLSTYFYSENIMKVSRGKRKWFRILENFRDPKGAIYQAGKDRMWANDDDDVLKE